MVESGYLLITRCQACGLLALCWVGSPSTLERLACHHASKSNKHSRRLTWTGFARRRFGTCSLFASLDGFTGHACITRSGTCFYPSFSSKACFTPISSTFLTIAPSMAGSSLERIHWTFPIAFVHNPVSSIPDILKKSSLRLAVLREFAPTLSTCASYGFAQRLTLLLLLRRTSQ